jgi:hypothetical protein
MLFGPRVFHTLHPKNVEAVLSVNFEGKHSLLAPNFLGGGVDAFVTRFRLWGPARCFLSASGRRNLYAVRDGLETLKGAPAKTIRPHPVSEIGSLPRTRR